MNAPANTLTMRQQHQAYCEKLLAGIDQSALSPDEQWHLRRRLGIGGSEIGTILGLNKYQTPFDLWLLKTGRKAPDGLLTSNPVSLVTVSRYLDGSSTPEGGAKDVDPFTPEEVSAIISTASGINEQWANLFAFAFATGMRPSEICALSWSSIDWIGSNVLVSSAKVVGVIKTTKTKAGTRAIELTGDALAALASQKRFTFMRGDYVFDDPKLGQPWAGADAIRKKAWLYTLKRSGVRYRHLYQTRHTFATANISRGCNLFWLSSQMGHKGPEMLFRHYGSYLSEYDGQTAKAPILIQNPLQK